MSIMSRLFGSKNQPTIQRNEAAAGETINKAFAAHCRGDYATALRLLRPLAEQGNANAQYNLGNMYMDGLGVPQNDAEAVKWFRRAADQGFVDAQSNLGAMYIDGKGVRQNHAEALRWLRLAADQGDAEAQSNLGNMYIKGAAVQQSIEEAMKWYRRAADQGRAIAQFNVGFGYASGQGVPQDDVSAHMWFNLSAAQGSHDAAKNLDTIEQIMTLAQIAEAQQLAREWKPKKTRKEGATAERRQPGAEQPLSARSLIKTRTPPWHRIAPEVTDAIFEALDATELFDCFVFASLENNLVSRYERISDKDISMIRAEISGILVRAGFQKLTALEKEATNNRIDAVKKLGFEASNLFEPAIAMSNDQTGGHMGMATLYGMLGIDAKRREWAERGLSELQRIKQSAAGHAMRDSLIIPPDALDQEERVMRRFLE